MKFYPLITRADDFGATPGTNDAILDALDGGLVRNAGVMAPAPFCAHRLHELRERQDECCLGMHATLTSEWNDFKWGPLSAPERVPSLRVEGNHFPKNCTILEAQARLPEMMEELAVQLNTLRNWGLRPRYLDSHMNFTWLPGMSEGLQTFCDREDLLFVVTPAYRGLRLSLSREQLPDSAEVAKAIAYFHEQEPTATPIWVFHPAYEDEYSRRFAAGTALQRHREAQRLALPEALCALLEMHALHPQPYVRPVYGS
jgi:predicted glycoside hydrolase/deacetylase ChbG (UPF0249 family)